MEHIKFHKRFGETCWVVIYQALERSKWKDCIAAWKKISSTVSPPQVLGLLPNLQMTIPHIFFCWLDTHHRFV
jgi:hypothetical protein